ncbi:hypothetical protein MPER_09438 [Moniliophthora perniciosa FA553]|nr:hypothetical protein MPER_09438 [Moniliophthora perniciosa FA553]
MSNFQLLLFPGGRDAEGKEKFGVFPPCAEPKLERLYDYRVREVALRAEVGVAGMCGPHGHLLMRPVVQGLMRGEFSLKRRGIGLEDIAFEFYAAPCAIWPLDGTITGPARIIMDQDHLISVFGML